ncbi:hypothetical protein [Acidisoma sp. 7E03]
MNTMVDAETSAQGMHSEADAQIAFILDHPGMSDWLKTALREALPRDPVAVLNDLELLAIVLRGRADALLTGMFG